MKKNEPKSAGPALGLNKNPSESDQIRPNPKTEVGTMGFVKCHYFQWVVNTTLAAFCTFRLQARRARSERPTTMDLRRCFSIPQSTSEFGLNQSKSNLKGGFRLKGSGFRSNQGGKEPYESDGLPRNCRVQIEGRSGSEFGRRSISLRA